ncbi:MAG TPA: PTS sugar transporter subunit IIA, partial [Candidatus Krumholzibacteria bacterium]|nr:PTS sugar transporter subunit IIA [Candidatus Krumholzibacteria bacterium]
YPLTLDSAAQNTAYTGQTVAWRFADLLGVSNLLACLGLGMTMVNLAPTKEEIGHRVFANFEPAVLAVFFTLAGAELDFGFLKAGWLLVAVVVAARAAGKIGAAWGAMRLAGAPPGVRRWLGPALLPQAGVAVGLLLDLREDARFAGMGALVLAVGVTAVAVNEIIGPLATRLGLARSGNLGQDRARLIDFIHEENIATGFQAANLEDAFAKLADLMVRSHGLAVDRTALTQAALRREAAMSTCIGRGLAVPHADLPPGSPLVGVMAVSREGLPFGTPDGVPIRCLVMLAAPPELAGRRLEVQAALARSVGSDWNLRSLLFAARTPAHVYEILHAEEAQDLNRFLDEDEAAAV